ncbi:Ig-like domain-containing protein, partial [Pseudobutyrivibrio xylanivorans]
MKNRKFLATFSLSLVVAAATVFCSMPVQAAEITMAKTAAAVTYGNTSSSEAALLRSIFDYEYYKKMNPDVVAKFGDSREALFNHFAKFGIYEGRSLSANFNVSAYASAYPDLKGKFGADIVKYYIHYAAVGSKEDRPITTLKAAADAGITVTSVADPTVVLTPAAIKAAEAKGITDPAAAMAAAPVASSGSSSSSSGGGGSASTKQNATKPEDNKEETPSEPAANVAVTGVTLDKITASIEVGEELALKATVKPENASVKKVTWSSSDTAVATVAEGKVTGVAAGTATITVTADGGKTATCTVTVTEPSEPEEPVAVENITVTAAGDATSITKGQTLQLTVEVTPENATNKEVEWSSDVETVTVSATGLVSVEADETATEVTITATAKDGSEVSDNITFTIADPVAVTGVTLNKSTTSIVEGTTETLEATVAPVDATNKNVTWSSDNEDVATVEDGVVTGVAAGTATITVTTEDGDFEAECEVTVTADETAPTLSLVSATRTAAETATLAFTSSEAGTYYYLVLAAAAEAPNAATIKAQGDAVAKGTAAATASANSVSITGLTADTAYKAYVVVEDAAVNISDVSTTDIASTAAEPPEDFTSLAIGVEGNVFTATASPSEGVTYQWY